MSTPETQSFPEGNGFAIDSLNVDIVVVEGNEDTTVRPASESSRLWLAYERDRIANPTTPRPYRPYLSPPGPSVPPPEGS